VGAGAGVLEEINGRRKSCRLPEALCKVRATAGLCVYSVCGDSWGGIKLTGPMFSKVGGAKNAQGCVVVTIHPARLLARLRPYGAVSCCRCETLCSGPEHASTHPVCCISARLVETISLHIYYYEIILLGYNTTNAA
jgi:hypothetical protein